MVDDYTNSIDKIVDKNFKDLLRTKEKNVETSYLGLSIRFFECLLHLSYKIPLRI